MARDDTPSTKPLLDKLGVKPEHRVAVLGLDDGGEFATLLATRTGDVYVDRRRVGLDQIFVRFDRREDLGRLHTHMRFIERNGAIWALWPKGTKAINDNDVRNAGLEAGLVDVKVVSFSPVLSALKLVYRLKDR
jgi:pimeloyl-ACP methyl ester carboxylesterase